MLFYCCGQPTVNDTANDVMYLKMFDQGTRFHPHHSLRELQTPQKFLSVGGDNPRHSLHVRPLQQSTRVAKGMAGHAHGIPNVFEETEPFKEVYEKVELPLQPLWSGRRNQPAIYVEESRKFLDGIPNSLRSCLHRRQRRHPVPDHVIHHHFGKCGGQRVALGYPMVYL